MHVSNRHITVGKKFFLWGNFPEAHVWDTVLTDNDGPYLELMVGCWSDNQPDYSWIAPYETRKVEQFWFPVKGIGGVKNVTIDGAVNVDRLKPDELLVGFHSTRVLKGCTVRVLRKGGGGGMPAQGMPDRRVMLNIVIKFMIVQDNYIVREICAPAIVIICR